MMESKIADIEAKRVKEPKNIKIYELSFLQDGKRIKKEVVKSMDVVKILLYHEEKDAFVLVKQFRPLVYINHPNLAFRYELCGGREDKEGLTSEEVAKEEVLEECGYEVNKLQKITTFVTGGKMTLYYAVVNESMRVNSGGGVDYEMIDLFFLPLKDAKKFMFDENIPKRPSLMFAFCWFFNAKI